MTTPNTAVDFWARVDRSGGPDSCWPWTGATTRTRYGQMWWQGKKVSAHRLALALAQGSIEEDLDVLHTCDNPPCCNPAHLFEGTHTQNMVDMVSKGRNAPNQGEANPNARLTAVDVLAIRSSLERTGLLARRFGVTRTTILSIRAGHAWRHLTEEGAA